ncbi:Rieske 2Fe-2S family protein [Alcanivorax xiamenensis]|uniref:Rieske 2Fe-2S family protein n=1 Tax=Alcanivorax xiamenensis TaxID=1177156 RepID=A0ABQ6Y9K6_9GAMM|nr:MULTISPECIES: Rieske (2Fe-2S) protein [Alcanivorax]KAF0806455.1 Rieske 2Fe-2S family protein [Alcanivorax xiamenensis]
MQAVCSIHDIEDDSAREFQVDDQPVVIVKRDGQFHAYLNWCPHLGIELNFMPDQFLDSDNQFIICANHGALFEIESGDCLSGPCSGDALLPVPLEIREEQIWLGEVPQPA